jgi:hypothetical protein
MKNICALILLLYSFNGFSQQAAFANDGEGRPIYFSRTNYTAEGSPFLNDEYRVAEVTLMSGKVYPYVNVKINLQENLVLYKQQDGTEIQVLEPIKKVKFLSLTTAENAHFEEQTITGIDSAINGAGRPLFVVLEEGKASLLKQLVVTFSDNKPYGGAGIVRTFKLDQTLFAQFSTNKKDLIKLKKTNKDVAALFKEEAVQVTAYIKQEGLSCKLEKDLKKVFTFYNSQQK